MNEVVVVGGGFADGDPVFASRGEKAKSCCRWEMRDTVRVGFVVEGSCRKRRGWRVPVNDILDEAGR